MVESGVIVWIMVVFMSGNGQAGFRAGEFMDKASCVEAGKSLIQVSNQWPRKEAKPRPFCFKGISENLKYVVDETTPRLRR